MVSSVIDQRIDRHQEDVDTASRKERARRISFSVSTTSPQDTGVSQAQEEDKETGETEGSATAGVLEGEKNNEDKRAGGGRREERSRDDELEVGFDAKVEEDDEDDWPGG